jgi:hypothetical protein
VHVGDDGGMSGSAWIRGCTPGVRPHAAADVLRTAAGLLAVAESADGGATLRLRGVDLQVVDGSGATYTPDGTSGNLILGHRMLLVTSDSHTAATTSSSVPTTPFATRWAAWWRGARTPPRTYLGERPRISAA